MEPVICEDGSQDTIELRGPFFVEDNGIRFRLNVLAGESKDSGRFNDQE